MFNYVCRAMALISRCLSYLSVIKQSNTSTPKFCFDRVDALIAELEMFFEEEVPVEPKNSDVFSGKNEVLSVEEARRMGSLLSDDFELCEKFDCPNGCIDGLVRNKNIGIPDDVCGRCGGVGFIWEDVLKAKRE